jgi:hypothetical protein
MQICILLLSFLFSSLAQVLSLTRCIAQHSFTFGLLHALIFTITITFTFIVFVFLYPFIFPVHVFVRNKLLLLLLLFQAV